MISAEESYIKKKAHILGYNMSYVDEGEGDPIVLLHGNPTSSYLWRNIIPHLSGLGRCAAPDLIGMGDSEKLSNSGPESYSFIEHRKYLDALLEEIGVTENVLLVLHDWGSGLGFDWAFRNQDKIKGIVYMEAVLFHYDWSDWPEDARKIFQGFRSPAGEKLILDKNYFIELVLPNSIIRELTPSEMDVYRRPFLNPGEDRRPTLSSGHARSPSRANPKMSSRLSKPMGNGSPNPICQNCLSTPILVRFWWAGHVTSAGHGLIRKRLRSKACTSYRRIHLMKSVKL